MSRTSSKYTITLDGKKKYFKNLACSKLPDFLGSICNLSTPEWFFFRVFEIYQTLIEQVLTVTKWTTWSCRDRFSGSVEIHLKLRFYVSCDNLRTIWSRVVSLTRYIHSYVCITFVMANKTSDLPQSPRLKIGSWTNLQHKLMVDLLFFPYYQEPALCKFDLFTPARPPLSLWLAGFDSYNHPGVTPRVLLAVLS